MATIDIGRKWGAVHLLGGAGSPSNTMWPGLPSYQVASSILHPSSRLVTIVMGKKWGLCLFLGGAESPSNTMSPGPRPSFIPSSSLVPLAVWPQQTSAKNCGMVCSPFLGGGRLGGAGSLCLTQCGLLGRDVPLYHVAS